MVKRAFSIKVGACIPYGRGKELKIPVRHTAAYWFLHTLGKPFTGAYVSTQLICLRSIFKSNSWAASARSRLPLVFIKPVLIFDHDVYVASMLD